MIIDCAHYLDGRRHGAGAVPLQEAAARCGRGGFVWLGLFEPADEELAQVRDTFGLHELAVEDAQNFGGSMHRPTRWRSSRTIALSPMPLSWIRPSARALPPGRSTGCP
jgi:hypothetical protein